MQSMTVLNTEAGNMKTGIFGGAFNPVHNGHIRLAKSYADSIGLDRVLFIPTAVPPHKTAEHLVSQQDRLNMLSLALDDNRFEVSDIEYRRDGKSYTYDTLMQLRADYPDDEFYLIIGADQFLTFDKWYRWSEILNEVTLCTSAREDEIEKQKIIDYAEKLGLVKDNYYLLSSPVYRLSSSQLRDMIKLGQDISSLVPDGVWQYISEKGLYSV